MTSDVATDVAAQLARAQQALDMAHYEDAIRALTVVHTAMPSDASIGMMLANAYHLAGDRVGACDVLLNTHARATARATISDPGTALAFGAALLDVGAAVEAAAHFTSVTRARPRDPAGLSALAAATRASGQPEHAWALMRRALAIAPAHPALLLTAAQIRHDLGDLTGALTWLDRAEAERPDHAPTQMQRAYTTLLGGASRDGWQLFESRPLPTPRTNARAWHGQPLDGANVLVTAEQGVGDQFQFVRFARLLAAHGAGHITVECHADAVSLLRANGYEAVARGSALETAWHVPMLSLPHRLGLDTNVCGDAVPYLRAPSSAVTSPAMLLHRDDDRRPCIGVVWSGNPAFPGRVLRDLPASLLPELVSDTRVRWLSLQLGGAGTHTPPNLEQSALPSDWSATADVLSALDGLVTTDTGIAHLAGAMGVPTWVMLQHVPDWRWGLRGATTPWYPSMRLVRQAGPGDWASVLASLREAGLYAAPTESETRR